VPELPGSLRLPRVNGSPPELAVGQLYYDTDLEKIGFWNGAEWIYLPTDRRGVTLFTGSDPPDDPEPGDVWMGDGHISEWDDDEDEWKLIGIFDQGPFDGGPTPASTGRGLDAGWPDTVHTPPPIDASRRGIP
jgi:hypothetical protein